MSRKTTRPQAAIRSVRQIWGAFFFAYSTLLLLASHCEHIQEPSIAALLAFFFGISLLSILSPATGPRGQRVVLLPIVAMASALLLPPLSAMLPILLANAIYAMIREAATTRAAVLVRGVWLATAAFVGSVAYHSLMESRSHSFLGSLLTMGCFFGVISIVGYRAFNWKSQAWYGWQIEAMTLIAGLPIAVLMVCVYPHAGVPGVALAASLLAMLLLIAHFGFEVAMLREQVLAMEKISAVTLSQTNISRIIERFLQLSMRLVNSDRAALWLTDEFQTRLERVALLQMPSVAQSSKLNPDHATSFPVVRFGEGLIGRVAERQMPLILRDAAQDPRTSVSEEFNRQGISTLLLPLVVGGEIVGVAQFERGTPGAYSNRDLGRVNSLVSQTAATIANVRMHQTVYNQSITDELTGLFNRRHMQQTLLEEYRRAQRYQHSLSIVMLDVDKFKSYNDTYGHPQGDVLLKMLASLLRENVRGVDIVGRYGGEEFMILMPQTTKVEAWRTAERLRQAVASASFPGDVNDAESIVSKTISLGLASIPEDGADPQLIIQYADEALYRAKHGGRNQIVVVGDPAVK